MYSLQSGVSFLLRQENKKRHLCHRSKLTVLSLRIGYLATESSRDTLCCVGSLNNSGITVKEWDTAGSSHSQQTYHGACGLKTAVRGCGRWLNQSEFQPTAERSLFSFSSVQRTLLAGKAMYGVLPN